MWAVGHPVQEEEGVLLKHPGEQLSKERSCIRLGWEQPSCCLLSPASPQFGQAGSLTVTTAAVLSWGVFAPSKLTSLAGTHR